MLISRYLRIISIILFSILVLLCNSCKKTKTQNIIDNSSSDSVQQKNIAIMYRVYGLNFSPYIDNQDPNLGQEISSDQIEVRMEIIANYTKWIRTFSCTHGLENCGFIAHSLGLKVALGAWLDSNSTTNEEEIENLIRCAKMGDADILIVGSEVLLRGDLTENELINYINRVKQEVPNIPVGYADTYAIFLSHPSIVDAIDIILVNYYPYWEGIRVNQAVAAINNWHQEILKIARGKKVIVSETGWPSEGNQIGNAIPSLQNASFYFLNFISWAKANNVDYFYFESFDELWKAKYEGSQGAHWGIWDKDGSLKPGMEKVFNGETVEDNWSNPLPGGPGKATIEFIYIPPYGSLDDLRGQVWHVNPNNYKIAVYIYVDGGWWTKPYWSNPLTSIKTDGSWICDITTGSSDQKATKIAAYLLPNGYSPPLGKGEPTLPQELEDNAITKLEITRSP